MNQRSFARELAEQDVRTGKPLEWFEALYHQAEGDETRIPWADLEANPNLTSWLEREVGTPSGDRALVVGCGLGDDAECLQRFGFRVTAFDLSATAIHWCHRRFPDSSVDYVVADLLDLPHNWLGAFDFVFEAYTLQVLPSELRRCAVKPIADSVAPNGTLLVVSRGRDAGDDPGTMPWRLLATELEAFADDQLELAGFEDYLDREAPPARRFRAWFTASRVGLTRQ